MFFGLLRGVGRFVIGTIVLVAVMVAVMNDSDARSLTVTGASVGGTATDIVITDAIPAFFAEISSDDKPAKKTEKKS